MNVYRVFISEILQYLNSEVRLYRTSAHGFLYNIINLLVELILDFKKGLSILRVKDCVDMI